MNGFSARSWLAAAVCGAALASNPGCQTYFPETGQTLPSPEYLRHPPQYFQPTPAFPLPKEQSGLEQAAAQPGPVPRPLLPPAP